MTRQNLDPFGQALPGADLQALVAGAEREVVLAAPFTKTAAVEGVLEHVPPGVVVTCITRWHPQEIAAGVSDPEVFHLLTKHPGAALLLWPSLHAKYYRADDRCLVGSANLTAKALGWVSPSNIELLIEASATHPRLVAFEQRAVAEAQPATAELYALAVAAAERIRQDRDWIDHTVEGKVDALQWDGEAEEHTGFWLPTLRYPSDLYRAYSGSLDDLTAASRIAALRDLTALDPPTGLSVKTFPIVIAASVLQMPMIARIDVFVETSQRFGAVRDLIASELGISKKEASAAWQTTMRWLLYFFPGRYLRCVPAHSEVFMRATGSLKGGMTTAS